MTPFATWELLLIRRFARVTTLSNLARVLQRPLAEVSELARREGIETRAPLGLEAVEELARMVRDCRPVSHQLAWGKMRRDSRKHEPWSATDSAWLEEHVGRRSIGELSRKLGRTKEAVRARINRQGLRGVQFEFSTGELARRLNCSRTTVYLWVKRGIENEQAGELIHRTCAVRSYRELRTARKGAKAGRRYIHREDALWLLEHWQGQAMRFPASPGVETEEE